MQQEINTKQMFLNINQFNDDLFLTVDLNFNNVSYQPQILNSNFEGFNHKISNIFINQPENVSNTLYFGIFSRSCTSIAIKNLLLYNITLHAFVKQSPSYSQVVVSILLAEGSGVFHNIQIHNISVSIYLNQNATTFGAVIGIISGSSTSILASFAQTILTLQQSDQQQSLCQIGGLIGFQGENTSINSSESIFSFSAQNNSDQVQIGGLVGWSTNQLRIQFSTSFLTLYTHNLPALAGGLVAFSYSQLAVSDCKTIIKGEKNDNLTTSTIVGIANDPKIFNTVSDDNVSSQVRPSITPVSCQYCFTLQANSLGLTVLSDPKNNQQYTGFDFQSTWVTVQNGTSNSTSQTAFLNISYTGFCEDNERLIDGKCFPSTCITNATDSEVCNRKFELCAQSGCCKAGEISVNMQCFSSNCVQNGVVCDGNTETCTQAGCNTVGSNKSNLGIGFAVSGAVLAIITAISIYFIRKRVKNAKVKKNLDFEMASSCVNTNKRDNSTLQNECNELHEEQVQSQIICDIKDSRIDQKQSNVDSNIEKQDARVCNVQQENECKVDAVALQMEQQNGKKMHSGKLKKLINERTKKVKQKQLTEYNIIVQGNEQQQQNIQGKNQDTQNQDNAQNQDQEITKGVNDDQCQPKNTQNGDDNKNINDTQVNKIDNMIERKNNMIENELNVNNDCQQIVDDDQKQKFKNKYRKKNKQFVLQLDDEAKGKITSYAHQEEKFQNKDLSNIEQQFIFKNIEQKLQENEQENNSKQEQQGNQQSLENVSLEQNADTLDNANREAIFNLQDFENEKSKYQNSIQELVYSQNVPKLDEENPQNSEGEKEGVCNNVDIVDLSEQQLPSSKYCVEQSVVPQSELKMTKMEIGVRRVRGRSGLTPIKPGRKRTAGSEAKQK